MASFLNCWHKKSGSESTGKLIGVVLQHVPIFSLIAASWQVASNCQRLEEPGHHPKWQEVNISAELPGWKRYPPAEAWLKRYLVASHSTAGSGSSIDERELRDIFSKFLDGS